MSIAEKLVTNLHRFNAKERNHLMRFALMGETDSSAVPLSEGWVHKSFFKALTDALATAPSGDEADPAIKLSKAARCIYAAMDYHLDWLHGALWETGSASHFPAGSSHPRRTAADLDGPARLYDVMGNQEDVDLLLVVEDKGMTYLVLVEAKGKSSFSRGQLASKLERLGLILDAEHVPNKDQLRFALVLLAPSRSQLGLWKSETYADLAMRPTRAPEPTFSALTKQIVRLSNVIIRMTMSNFPKNLERVSRCDSPDGKKRTHWKIVPR